MISRPEQDGDRQLRLLGDAWDKAAEHWRDSPARQFGTAQLTPLLQESRCYREALRKLMDLLEAAERGSECQGAAAKTGVSAASRWFAQATGSTASRTRGAKVGRVTRRSRRRGREAAPVAR